MLEKIKQFFASIIGISMLLLTTAVGILLWMLSNKRKELNSLRAQIALADTQREVDLLEVQIKERLASKDLLDKEVQELKKTLLDIENKRSQIAAKEKSVSVDDVERFWRNN